MWRKNVRIASICLNRPTQISIIISFSHFDLFFLICKLPVCSKRSSVLASEATLEDCHQRILVFRGSSAPWHISRALQTERSANPNPSEPEASASCSSAPGQMLLSILIAWHRQHSGGRAKQLHWKAVLQQGPLPQSYFIPQRYHQVPGERVVKQRGPASYLLNGAPGS